MLRQRLQTAVQMIYPPRCLVCGGLVESDFGLCGTCWRDTPFITGLVCDLCGVPLPGTSDLAEHCDECLKTVRPWVRGRAALCYRDNGRKLVLGLKHGDRHDIVPTASLWMARVARPMLTQDMVIVPVPLHFYRLLQRRFNQSAVLAQAMARQTGLSCCPDALIRTTHTASLDGKSREDRFATLSGALAAHPKRAQHLAGKAVLLVDDVMTSGATLSTAAEVCLAAGAREVCVTVLARVAKDA